MAHWLSTKKLLATFFFLTILFAGFKPACENLAFYLLSSFQLSHAQTQTVFNSVLGYSLNDLSRVSVLACAHGDGVTDDSTCINNLIGLAPQAKDIIFPSFRPGYTTVANYAVSNTINLGNGVPATAISSGTWNNSTKVLTLTLSTATAFPTGASVVLSSITGTGAYNSLNQQTGTVTSSGASSTSLILSFGTAYGTLTVTGGTAVSYSTYGGVSLIAEGSVGAGTGGRNATGGGYPASTTASISWIGASTAVPVIKVAGPLQGYKIHGLNIACNGNTYGLMVAGGQFGEESNNIYNGCQISRAYYGPLNINSLVYAGDSDDFTDVAYDNIVFMPNIANSKGLDFVGNSSIGFTSYFYDYNSTIWGPSSATTVAPIFIDEGGDSNHLINTHFHGTANTETGANCAIGVRFNYNAQSGYPSGIHHTLFDYNGILTLNPPTCPVFVNYGSPIAGSTASFQAQLQNWVDSLGNANGSSCQLIGTVINLTCITNFPFIVAQGTFVNSQTTQTSSATFPTIFTTPSYSGTLNQYILTYNINLNNGPTSGTPGYQLGLSWEDNTGGNVTPTATNIACNVGGQTYGTIPITPANFGSIPIKLGVLATGTGVYGTCEYTGAWTLTQVQ